WDLSANYSFELLRHDLVRAVGPERMAQLMPPYATHGLSIVADGTGEADAARRLQPGVTGARRLQPSVGSRGSGGPYPTHPTDPTYATHATHPTHPTHPTPPTPAPHPTPPPHTAPPRHSTPQQPPTHDPR